MHALGVGPRPVPFQRITEEWLAGAISEAVGSAEIRRRAGDLGARLRLEDGVQRAVAAFDGVFEKWPGWENVGTRGRHAPRIEEVP